MLTRKYYADDVCLQEGKTYITSKDIFFQFFAAYSGAIFTLHLQLLLQTPVASSAITTCVIWLLLLPTHKDRRFLILAAYCGPSLE